MRAKRTAPASQPLIATIGELDTGVCVPAIRAEVAAWLASGDYPGVTTTTRTLLHHWFQTDHRLRDRRPFAYHHSQRRAVETLVYLSEVAGISNQQQMFERYAQAGQDIRLASSDPHARFAVKMATGSGKTKVMSLAIAWQYFNAVLEPKLSWASTFLVIAPNVIVFQRLQRDFRNGAIFRADPVIPPSLAIHWDFDCYMRGDGERGYSAGALYLTNIQQLYSRPPKASLMPEPMEARLGPATIAHGCSTSLRTDPGGVRVASISPRSPAHEKRVNRLSLLPPCSGHRRNRRHRRGRRSGPDR